MKIRRVVPIIKTNCLEETKRFYTEFLGFRLGMDLGSILTFVSPSNETAQISFIPDENSTGAEEVVDIEVDEIDKIHACAVEAGHEIVYSIRIEPWGVRRFFVKDPNGVTINVMTHLPSEQSSY